LNSRPSRLRSYLPIGWSRRWGALRWQVLTDAKVTLAGAVATLEKDGHRLILTCTNAALVWQLAAATPPSQAEKANPNQQILSLETPAAAALTLTVHIAAASPPHRRRIAAA
jgi:hypothetical protein